VKAEARNCWGIPVAEAPAVSWWPLAIVCGLVFWAGVRAATPRKRP
jgi:hypothetical protein